VKRELQQGLRKTFLFVAAIVSTLRIDIKLITGEGKYFLASKHILQVILLLNELVLALVS